MATSQGHDTPSHHSMSACLQGHWQAVCRSSQLSLGMTKVSACHQPGCCILADASWLGRRSRGAHWAEKSILSQVHCCLCLGSPERHPGVLYLLSLLRAHPEGASWQTLTFALGRRRESMALLADLGWDALHLESSWNFTTWRPDKNPHISAELSSSSIWNLASVGWLCFKDPVEELLEMGWTWTGALPQIWQKTVAGFSRVAIRTFLLYCSISTLPLVFLLWDSSCN